MIFKLKCVLNREGRDLSVVSCGRLVGKRCTASERVLPSRVTCLAGVRLGLCRRLLVRWVLVLFHMQGFRGNDRICGSMDILQDD